MKSRSRRCWQVLFASFVLSVCATLGTGQTSQLDKGPGRLVEQHYRNSGGEKGLTTYLYDHNGLMYRARWGLLDGSRHSDNYHTLDARGNVTRKYREFSDGSKSTVDYVYDEKGRLVSESFRRSDGAAGTTTYEYDDAGRLAKANCDHLNTWFTGTIVYKHDEQGRLASARLLRGDQQLGTIAYEHDDAGNLTREHWDFNGVWDQTSTYVYVEVDPKQPPSWTSTNVYVVDTAGYRQVSEHYDFNGEMSGSARFDYDESGKLVGKRYETSSGLWTETTLEYDANGLLTKTHRKYSNGLTAEFTYRFNGNRRLVHRTFARSDGVVGAERYEYDDKMRLSKAVYENFDTWLTGTITYEHAEDGGIEKAHFDGERFDAEIDFDRDEHGNVTRMQWVLESGQTQTYELGYEVVSKPSPPKPREDEDRRDG